MLGWFKALMPKEERFFALFVQHATIVVAGAEALRGVLEGGDEVERYCRIVSERENEADEITRQVLIAVRRTFITPFDRTDIQDLVQSLDDSIDQMNKTAKTVMLFEVRRFEPQMQQMGDIILQASKLILEAMPLLASIPRNAGRLAALTEEVIRIEEQADAAARSGPQDAVPRQQARARQRDGLHHQHRALRSSGVGGRPARRRLERDQRAHRRSALTGSWRWMRSSACRS